MRTLTILIPLAAVLCAASSPAGENIPSLQGGYQDGFYLKTPDDRFLLKVGSRINFGYTYGWVSPLPDFSSFDLFHAKIYAGGNAFGQTVQFYIQAGAATTTRSASFAPTPESDDGSFTLEDYYVRLVRGDFSLKLGQFKVPFIRQAMTYSGNLNLVDRSIATRSFLLGRDRGVTFNWDRRTFSTSMGVFNGGGDSILGSGLQPLAFGMTGQNVSNDTAGGGKGHLYSVRLVAAPFGSAGYSEGDVERTDKPRFDIGAGFVFDQGRDLDVNGDGTVDDTDADVINVSGDLAFKSNGFFLQGEYFYRTIDGAALSDLDMMGFYVQPSYFIMPGELELATRFSWVDPDMDTAGDRLYEAQAAFNFYFFKDHRYKLQLQYTWRGQELALGGRNDDSLIDLVLQLTI
jgi:phosphate-selective porin OprO and OprP